MGAPRRHRHQRQRAVRLRQRAVRGNHRRRRAPRRGRAVVSKGRTDTASRVIRAPAQKIYAAHVDPQAVAQWRPPQGMRAEIYSFDARAGGGYRMAFVYEDASVAGKTTGNADEFEGQFVVLVPGERIVERVEFRSDDPAFAGVMTITTALVAVTDGTRVDI
ncbi:MAG: SRPBCC domain-containing protein, partial [Hyphomicrobium sp.]|nr:SRPBCC domain-containing protein [Hyphomicrobium sp.]